MSESGTQHASDDEKSEALNDSVELTESADRQKARQARKSQSRKPEPLLNLDELRELLELISSHGFTDFEVEREGIKVKVRRGSSSQGGSAGDELHPSSHANAHPAGSGGLAKGAQSAAVWPPLAPHPGAEAEAAASVDEDLQIITSPIVGTFFRSPSPSADAFVSLGSTVKSDTVVCIIEAMKLMNEIQAETSGEVAKIYVENGQPVEFGQPLFGIRT